MFTVIQGGERRRQGLRSNFTLVAAQIKTILFVDKENNIEDFNVN
jgi:hypothetical protein